jgi:hypothetical protein
MKLSRNPSIWLLGIVGRKNGWFHQILGGVIYTSGILKTAEPRSVLLTTLLFKSPSMTHLKRTMSLP